MRKIDEVIIHASATRPDWMADRPALDKVAEIRRWHTSPPNNWSDFGYHFLIDRDGAVVKGRPVARVGAHVRGRNKASIGIVLVGGFGGAATDHFTDHFTPAQDKALRRMLADMRSIYGPIQISGHNEYADKGCPCFNVTEWLHAESPKRVAEPVNPLATRPSTGPFGAFIIGQFKLLIQSLRKRK